MSARPAMPKRDRSCLLLRLREDDGLSGWVDVEKWLDGADGSWGSCWEGSAADWWGKALRFSSPGFIIIECLSSLVVAQQLGRVGKNLVEEREGAQFGLLIASAVAYVASAVSIVWVSGL